MPQMPEPRPRVVVFGDREWRGMWLREQRNWDLNTTGIYLWEHGCIPTIYVRAGRYFRSMPDTYAHEHGHHYWFKALDRKARQHWKRFASGNPSLMPEVHGAYRKSGYQWEEFFAKSFGCYFSGGEVPAPTARRLREVCGLPREGVVRMRSAPPPAVRVPPAAYGQLALWNGLL
jgi:hypothetical protein